MGQRAWLCLPDSCRVQMNESNVQSFPGGSVVKNPPAGAGHNGSVTDLGRSHVPRAPQLQNLCSGVREPQLLSPTCQRDGAPPEKQPQ